MAGSRREAGSRRSVRRGVALALLAAVVLLVSVAYIWRGEIWRTALDPKQPYPTYRPPTAPDYAKANAWALRPRDPAHPASDAPPAEVFFVHPTTYAGGRDWNAPIGDRSGEAFLKEVVLPNYAGPFQWAGRVWAPRYRAASLFAFLTLRDDARDARRFAYGDVRAAFDAMLSQAPPERPLVLVGAGQGAALLARLIQERIAPNPRLKGRVAAAYLIDSVTARDALPADGPLSPCQTRGEAGCTLAWSEAPAGQPDRGQRRVERALTWAPDGRLVNLDGRPIVCVNPITGGLDQPFAPAKASRGAANATGLEWGARPAFLAHQVSAACEAGLLRISTPLAASLQRRGGWVSRRYVAPFNLFYADEAADVQARLAEWARARQGPSVAPPSR